MPPNGADRWSRDNLAGLAWTGDGRITTPDDPAALPGFPTAQDVQFAYAGCVEVLQHEPNDRQLRTMLSIMAVPFTAAVLLATLDDLES
jgi:hypothetical protein